jgi:hypothetical protein
MDVSQILVSVITIVVSVGLAQFTIRQREFEHATRKTLVNLHEHVRRLAHEYIGNVCNADRYNLGGATPQDAEESVRICRDTRLALIAVEGDMLSLEMLTGEIGRELEAALNKLLTETRKFVPTSRGGRFPEPEAYRGFEIEKSVEEVDNAIRNAWKKFKAPVSP